MCRLLGMSFGDKSEDLSPSEISALMFPELVRQGPHAYGWMSYNPRRKNPVTVKKYRGRADSTQATDRIFKMVDDDCRWLVGHTRWATHGDPSYKGNNHPLVHGNIVGVHNGVIQNYRDILKKTGREDDKAEVDSEAIFAAVNKWGPVDGLKKIQGSMVAIFAHLNAPTTIRIARSRGRQLHLGFTDRGNIVFASDILPLYMLDPWINFKRFSAISENRLLVIRDGQIIQRIQFAPKSKPAYHMEDDRWWDYYDFKDKIHQGKSVKPTKAQSRDDKGYERWLAQNTASKADKRGAILFPDGQPPKRNKSKGKNNRSGKAKNRKDSPSPRQRLTLKMNQEEVDALKRGSMRGVRIRNSGGMVWFQDELVTPEEYVRLTGQVPS